VNGYHNNVFFVCVLLFAIPCEILSKVGVQLFTPTSRRQGLCSRFSHVAPNSASAPMGKDESKNASHAYIDIT
jgi:hypothetical protein